MVDVEDVRWLGKVLRTMADLQVSGALRRRQVPYRRRIEVCHGGWELARTALCFVAEASLRG